MNSFDMWQKFVTSGKITDYLEYKNAENKRVEYTNENKNQGTYHKRENSWGE